MAFQMWTTDLALNEDGQRVSGTKTFEWWYFDTIMDDGSTCAITFLTTTPFFGGSEPYFGIDISTPDGKLFHETTSSPGATFAVDRCDVDMGGGNYVKFEETTKTYSIQVATKTLAATLELKARVPGWRTGPFLTPAQAAQQWLGEQVIIPSGTVSGTLTYPGGSSVKVTGTCYHDHQWGGVDLAEPSGGIASWYWGRASIGDHSIVFAQVMGKDGEPKVALFMFARESGMTVDTNIGALSVRTIQLPDEHGAASHVNLGPEVTWRTEQGLVRLVLYETQTILPLKNGYTRYLSTAVLETEFAGERFSGIGSAIWEHMKF